MFKQILKCTPIQSRFLFQKIITNSCISKFKIPNLKISCVFREFHSSFQNSAKLFFVDVENRFIYDGIRGDNNCFKSIPNITSVLTTKDFTDLLDRNWRLSSISEIVNAFCLLKDYCRENDIKLTNTEFDKLVDGLMDHCEKLTDDQLYLLLTTLKDFPFCDGYTAHNFHDVWSCLDDICCWKMHNWNTQKLFKFADVWYELNLGRLGEYMFEVVDKCSRKPDKLSCDELVRIFFYLNIIRRRTVDFGYEYALQNHIKQMTTNQMAAVALGYFKTKSKIKLMPIISTMLERIIQERKNIHELTLTALLKVIRLSKPGTLNNEVQEMLNYLLPEMDRFSLLCQLHIALISTGQQYPHLPTLKKAAENITKNMSDINLVRFKDIERLLNALTMFNVELHSDPDVYKTAFNEINDKKRLPEIARYKRCLASALNYFSLRNMYSYELMNKVFDSDFISEVYGNNARLIPHELFSLDCCIDIDCPDYNGNRLPTILKYKAAKWLTDYTPSVDQFKKLTAADKLVLDTISQIKNIVKCDKCLHIDHVLPHFSKADIILCKDVNTGKFIEPIGFERYVLGDIKFPIIDKNIQWYAVIVIGWNSTVRHSSLLLGNMKMKERQLLKIGYKPVLVIWNEFINLSSEEKINYISNKLEYCK